MKKAAAAAALCAALLLSGCGSFLNREYAETTPHTATWFSTEDRSVLRVESYQDLVSGLLLLIGGRADEGTVWLYPDQEMSGAADAVSRACAEVREETPLGSYAVSYITHTIDDSAHNYSVVHLTFGYRRPAEQVSSMLRTTGVSALYDLLPGVAESGGRELVLQVSRFDQTREEVRRAVAELQLELVLGPEPEAPEQPPEEGGEEPPQPEEPAPRELPEGVEPWVVNFYPEEGDVGIIEVLLNG